MPAATASDSDSDSDSDDEAPKTKAKVVPAKVAAAATSSSDSDDSDDETPKKAVVAAAATTSDSDDSDSDDEAEKKPVAKKAAADSDSDDSDSDDDEDVKMGDATKKTVAPVTNGMSICDFSCFLPMLTCVFLGKRKATDDAPAPPKKVKLANGDAAPAGSSEICNVFVGQLSWAVDDARLASEFADCGEVLSAHVQLDRNTGRSRGFGYINFSTPEAAQKALTYAGKEIDGRPINVDLSTPKPTEDRQNDRAKKFGDSTSSPSQTLFVGNLSFDATEDVVWEFFGEHAPVKSVRLPTDRETGRPKGFGYVEFESLDGATTAFEAASGAEIAGRMIRLDYSQPRDASGGGGGRGGFGGDRGGRGGGRGFGGDRGGRGGGRGFGDRGGGRGGRGGFGDRGGRGGGRGRGAPNPRTGGIVHSDGGKKKITF